MTSRRTFTQAVQARAAETPDRAALVLLGDEDASGTTGTTGTTGDTGDTEAVGYRELDLAARDLAGWLQQHGATGERVLIVQPSRKLFAVSFLACLYAGALAVPAPPPTGRGHHHQDRVSSILKDAAVRLTLTDRAGAPGISQLLARTGYGHVGCLPADAVPRTSTSDSGSGSDGGDGGDGDGHMRWIAPDIDADTPAFLQYTSGSTRDPRGAVITHGNILANLAAISDALRVPPGARVGGWLPFHHDMGLVGQLLLPLWLGGTSVLLTPESFVKKPFRWLDAIARHRLTVSGAPDFAYDLCVRRVTDEQLAGLERDGLDLSGWRTAVSGGEPVRPETQRAFAERFAPAGLRPGALTACYGLAEATLMVSGAPAAPHGAAPVQPPPAVRPIDVASLEHHVLRPPRAGEHARHVVSCGSPIPATGAELRVVNPESGATCPDGHVGEIWLRGPSVARGYWGRPSETAETFQAETADGRRGWLRTGDLGALVAGGLYVTGRSKDVMVIAGRNLYPQDVERAAQRVSDLFGSSTAFGVHGTFEPERVVIVQELRARSRYDVDLAALAAAVDAALVEELEVSAGGVLLVRPGTVRRTTSGKVERAAMRELFLRGELKPLHQKIEPEIQRMLTGRT